MRRPLLFLLLWTTIASFVLGNEVEVGSLSHRVHVGPEDLMADRPRSIHLPTSLLFADWQLGSASIGFEDFVLLSPGGLRDVLGFLWSNHTWPGSEFWANTTMTIDQRETVNLEKKRRGKEGDAKRVGLSPMKMGFWLVQEPEQ